MHLRRVNEGEEWFFFSLKRDVLNKFMLYVVVVRSAKGKTLHPLEITPNGTEEK